MRIKSAFLAAAALTTLTGCPPPNQLTILGEDIAAIQAMKKLSDSGAIPGAPHPIDFTLEDYDHLVNKANHDLTAGTGVYDVILQYNTAVANYVRNDFIVTLDQFEESVDLGGDLFQNVWKEVGWYKASPQEPEEPFGIPFAANSMILAVNTRLLEDPDAKTRYSRRFGRQLRPPETWEELWNVAEFFTDPDAGTFGIAMQGSSYFIYYEWANFAFGRGGGVMEKPYGWVSESDTPFLLTNPKTVEATKLYIDLSEFAPRTDYLSTDATNQIQRLRRGDVALGIIWSDVAYDLVAGSTQISDTFDFIPIPGDVSMLAGGSFYINKQSARHHRAIQFVAAVMKQEVQVELMKKGLCSPLKTAYTDEVIQEIPYAEALRSSLDRGVYMLEAGPDSDMIIVEISKALQTLWKTRQDRGAVDLETVREQLVATERAIQDQRVDILQRHADQ